MFDYSWVSDETKPEYEAVLKEHALKFLQWRAKAAFRRQWTLERAVKYWWLEHGPTAFRTTEDALRFKLELIDYLGKMRDDAAEVPTA